MVGGWEKEGVSDGGREEGERKVRERKESIATSQYTHVHFCVKHTTYLGLMQDAGQCTQYDIHVYTLYIARAHPRYYTWTCSSVYDQKCTANVLLSNREHLPLYVVNSNVNILDVIGGNELRISAGEKDPARHAA